MRLKSLLLLGGFALAAFQCLAEYSVTVPPGVYAAINAISALIVVFFGGLILLSERLRSPQR